MTPRARAGALALALVLAPGAGAQPVPPRLAQVIARAQALELRGGRDSLSAILHCVIAFGRDCQLRDSARGRRVDAAAFLLQRAGERGRSLIHDVGGRPRPARLPLQAHADQLLMALAEAGLPAGSGLVAHNGRGYTLRDLLRSAQTDFDEYEELGWTLMALSAYLPAGERWRAGGREWGLEDVLQLALYRDPRMEAEEGSHHLQGVAHAWARCAPRPGARAPQAQTRVWRDARRYLDNFIAQARDVQQPNGDFSMAGFRGSLPPTTPQIAVQVTGHALEWLVVALPPEELGEPWVRRSVTRLVELLASQPLERFEPSSMYHAIHALRVWQAGVGSARRGPARAAQWR